MTCYLRDALEPKDGSHLERHRSVARALAACWGISPPSTDCPLSGNSDSGQASPPPPPLGPRTPHWLPVHRPPSENVRCRAGTGPSGQGGQPTQLGANRSRARTRQRGAGSKVGVAHAHLSDAPPRERERQCEAGRRTGCDIGRERQRKGDKAVPSGRAPQRGRAAVFSGGLFRPCTSARARSGLLGLGRRQLVVHHGVDLVPWEPRHLG